MNKRRFFKVALAGVAVLFFCVVAQMQNRLNQKRDALGLTRLPPLKNAPPLLAFTTVALGGFRGLIANALWMRAGELQENEKFYEMVQLADWITALEPHFTQVWTMQAWNMAYNISVKFKDPEDRWHWVERGIVLLRDRGIPLNPDAALLYRELSWLYQHKMGQNLDDAHMRYKLRWAQEMQNVLGGHPDIEALEHPVTAEQKERARKLREVYKMDPEIIQKVDEEYGPFDWRLPDAHAVYWAELYRQHAKLNAEDTDTLRRSIFQTLRTVCFRGGALSPSVTNVTARNFHLWPNLDLVPKISAAYLKMIEEQPHINFQNAHKNFLKEAIPLLYLNGRVKQAAYWFDYMKNTYTNALILRQKDETLRDFVIANITEDDSGTDMNRVTANIVGMFTTEFTSLLQDNDEEAANYDRLARDVYKHYHDKIGPISNDRLKLQPLAEIRQRVLDEMLSDTPPVLPPYAQNYLRTKLGLKAPTPATTESPTPVPQP